MKGITRYPIYALLATGLLLGALLVLTPQPISRAAPRVLYAAPDGAISGNCNSWVNACTLQYALSLTQSGDEIWVKAGVHYPGPVGDRTATFALKSGVALYGGFAGTENRRDARNWQANPTVLSGDIDRNDRTDANGVVTTTAHITGTNAYHVVTAENVDSTAVLDGFIITAGKADTYPHSYGGGMYAYSSTLTLRNIIFTGNSASYGGGMYNSGSNPMLTNVTFSGNSAHYDGGGMYNRESNPRLINVIFDGNVSADSGGGGMFNLYSSPVLANVVFHENIARSCGGMCNVWYSSPILSAVVFSNNYASDHGGGGMVNAGFSNPTLINVAFSGNSAPSGEGGGIYCVLGSSPTLINVSLHRNTAQQKGGGVCNYHGNLSLINVIFSSNQAANGGGMYNYAYDNMGNSMLLNVTFSGNTATESGGGLYFESDPASSSIDSPVLINAILWNNRADVGPELYDNGGHPMVFHSDIRGCGGSGSGWNSACGIDGGGNIDADPLFVDATAGNLRLRAGSPAIDAGLNSAVPAGVFTDLDGNPRFVDFTGRGTAIVDMGAYEVQRPLPFRVYLPLVMRNR